MINCNQMTMEKNGDFGGVSTSLNNIGSDSCGELEMDLGVSSNQIQQNPSTPDAKLRPRKNNKDSKCYLDVVFECGDDESEGGNDDGQETSSTADDDEFSGDECLDSHLAFLG